MIVHSTLLLVTTVISLWLGVFVFWRNRYGEINRSWLILALGFGGWCLGSALMLLVQERALALWAARLAHVGAAVIPVAFFRFSTRLIEAPLPNRFWVVTNRWVSIAFGILALTPFLVSDVTSKLAFRYYMVPGPMYGIFLVMSAGYFVTTFALLVMAYWKGQKGHQERIKYILLASSLGFVCYGTAFPLVYDIQIPPVGSLLILYYFILAYAVVRWRLMDVRVVIKNTVLYTLLYSVVVGLFVMVVVFVGQWLFYGSQSLDKRVLWMSMVALSVVVAALRPLDNFLRKATDKIFFQRQREYQKTLRAASKGMTQVTSTKHLVQLMAHFIGMRIRVNHVGVMMRFNHSFRLEVSRGPDKKPLGAKLSGENALVRWLKEKKDVLVYDELTHWLRSEELFPHKTVLRKSLEEIREEMQELDAQICVPAFSKDRMLGFLILGEKRSGDPYTQEDVDILSTIANEAAVAMENAILYEQLYRRMQEIQELYEREHQMFVHTAISLAAAVDARDPYTHGHTERVTAYSLAIAEQLSSHPEIRSNPRFLELLNIAALLHDVGKIGVPDEILNKRGRHTPKEMKKMQEHPLIGAVIMQPIQGLEEVARAVKAHHERYDYKGYPDGLGGDEIPLMARIISVADAFDAMSTDRPYGKRLGDEAALEQIRAFAGSQFDPQVVEAFFKAHEKGRIVHRPVDTKKILRAQ